MGILGHVFLVGPKLLWQQRIVQQKNRGGNHWEEKKIQRNDIILLDDQMVNRILILIKY